MPETKTGKRSATFTVQIVEDGSTIEMFLNAKSNELAPIVLKKETGASGPKAYEKLALILDAEN